MDIKKSFTFICLVLYLSACSTKGGLPKPRSSVNSIETDTLYFKKLKNKIEINNKTGVRLKDFYPYSGYDLGYNECGAAVFNFYKSSKCKTNKSYRDATFAVEKLPLTILINTIGLVAVKPILSLGLFPNHAYFDWDEYYIDMESSFRDSKIDKNILLNKYKNYKTTKTRYQEEISSKINDVDNSLEEVLVKYKKQYSYYPTIEKIYIDKSGFYNNELLKEKVRFSENYLSRDVYIKDIDYGRVNILCSSMHECNKNIADEQKKIDLKHIQYISEINNDRVENLSKLNQILKDKSSYLNIIYNYKNLQENLQEETNLPYWKSHINYTIESPIKIDSNKEKLVVKYVIESVDFMYVYPDFFMEDKDIKVKFDSKTKTIFIVNKKDRFVEINSIALYYNNKIFNINNNEIKNFSIQIAPQTFYEYDLDNLKYNSLMTSEYLANSTKYYKMTVDKSKNIYIDFGFAIKYKSGDLTKTRTLYKQEKTQLLKIIKQ